MNLLTLLQDILSALFFRNALSGYDFVSCFFVRVILAAGGFASEYLQRKNKSGGSIPRNV